MKRFFNTFDRAATGAVFTLLVLALQLLTAILLPMKYVSSVCLIVVIGCAMIACLSFYAFFKSRYANKAPDLPRVKNAKNLGSQVFLIASPVAYISQDMLVSVFIDESGLEALIAIGRVQTINAKGMLQIELLRTSASWNCKVNPRDLIVRPSAPLRYLEGEGLI